MVDTEGFFEFDDSNTYINTCKLLSERGHTSLCRELYQHAGSDVDRQSMLEVYVGREDVDALMYLIDNGGMHFAVDFADLIRLCIQQCKPKSLATLLLIAPQYSTIGNIDVRDEVSISIKRSKVEILLILLKSNYLNLGSSLSEIAIWAIMFDNLDVIQLCLDHKQSELCFSDPNNSIVNQMVLMALFTRPTILECLLKDGRSLQINTFKIYVENQYFMDERTFPTILQYIQIDPFQWMRLLDKCKQKAPNRTEMALLQKYYRTRGRYIEGISLPEHFGEH